MNSLVTKDEAQPGTKVRALVDYCDRFGCPFGAIGTIVGRSDFGNQQHVTIRWELHGEGTRHYRRREYQPWGARRVVCCGDLNTGVAGR